jgi:hypothetical protein
MALSTTIYNYAIAACIRELFQRVIRGLLYRHRAFFKKGANTIGCAGIDLLLLNIQEQEHAQNNQNHRNCAF